MSLREFTLVLWISYEGLLYLAADGTFTLRSATSSGIRRGRLPPGTADCKRRCLGYASRYSSKLFVSGAIDCIRIGLAQDEVCAARLFISVSVFWDEYSKFSFSGLWPVLGLDFLYICFESRKRLWFVVDLCPPVIGLLSPFVVRVAHD